MTKFNLIRFDQISEHLRTPKQQIGSEQVPQASPRPASTELREFSQSFKVLSQPSNEQKNYLPLQPFFNNTHFGQTLINCIHNQHRFGIPDEYFVETCISTSTHNGFVTKEFVKIDEDSQTRDYTIIYIKFQGQTPPFTTLNQDIFDRVLPRRFPQVGDTLSEEEDSESEPELLA